MLSHSLGTVQWSVSELAHRWFLGYVSSLKLYAMPHWKTYVSLCPWQQPYSGLCFTIITAPCGLWGCKIRPAAFPGQMSHKATKPGLVLFYILACFNCIVVSRAPFFVLLIFVGMCSVKLSLLAKWRARKTPLRKPNHGEGIISIKIALVYCILLSLFYCMIFVFSPGPIWYISYFCGILPICAESAN